VSTKQQSASSHLAARAHLSGEKVLAETSFDRIPQGATQCTTSAFAANRTHDTVYPQIARQNRASYRARSISTRHLFNHFRTLFHSFPGSPLLASCSPKHTGGIPPSSRPATNALSEFAPVAATNPMPSARYGWHAARCRLLESARLQPRHNRISRAKISTALAAPVASGNRFGLAATLPRSRSFGRSAHKL
jgi:hypothetical protein